MDVLDFSNFSSWFCVVVMFLLVQYHKQQKDWMNLSIAVGYTCTALGFLVISVFRHLDLVPYVIGGVVFNKMALGITLLLVVINLIKEKRFA